MPNVIIRRYNTFFDHKTNVQFNPVLDKAAGLYIGLAVVPDELVEHFASNSAYEILTDSQLAQLTTGRADLPAKKSRTAIVGSTNDFNSSIPSFSK